MVVMQFQHPLPMLSILLPHPTILPLLIPKSPHALFHVFRPASLVVHILRIVIPPIPLPIPVHPVPLIDDLLPLTRIHRLPQQHSFPMRLILFKTTSILNVLLREIIHPISLYILANQLSFVSITIRQLYLFLSDLHSYWLLSDWKIILDNNHIASRKGLVLWVRLWWYLWRI